MTSNESHRTASYIADADVTKPNNLDVRLKDLVVDYLPTKLSLLVSHDYQTNDLMNTDYTYVFTVTDENGVKAILANTQDGLSINRKENSNTFNIITEFGFINSRDIELLLLNVVEVEVSLKVSLNAHERTYKNSLSKELKCQFNTKSLLSIVQPQLLLEENKLPQDINLHNIKVKEFVTKIPEPLTESVLLYKKYLFISTDNINPTPLANEISVDLVHDGQHIPFKSLSNEVLSENNDMIKMIMGYKGDILKPSDILKTGDLINKTPLSNYFDTRGKEVINNIADNAATVAYSFHGGKNMALLAAETARNTVIEVFNGLTLTNSIAADIAAAGAVAGAAGFNDNLIGTLLTTLGSNDGLNDILNAVYTTTGVGGAVVIPTTLSALELIFRMMARLLNSIGGTELNQTQLTYIGQLNDAFKENITLTTDQTNALYTLSKTLVLGSTLLAARTAQQSVALNLLNTGLENFADYDIRLPLAMLDEINKTHMYVELPEGIVIGDFLELKLSRLLGNNLKVDNNKPFMVLAGSLSDFNLEKDVFDLYSEGVDETYMSIGLEQYLDNPLFKYIDIPNTSTNVYFLKQSDTGSGYKYFTEINPLSAYTRKDIDLKFIESNALQNVFINQVFNAFGDLKTQMDALETDDVLVLLIFSSADFKPNAQLSHLLNPMNDYYKYNDSQITLPLLVSFTTFKLNQVSPKMTQVKQAYVNIENNLIYDFKVTALTSDEQSEFILKVNGKSVNKLYYTIDTQESSDDAVLKRLTVSKDALNQDDTDVNMTLTFKVVRNFRTTYSTHEIVNLNPFIYNEGFEVVDNQFFYKTSVNSFKIAFEEKDVFGEDLSNGNNTIDITSTYTVEFIDSAGVSILKKESIIINEPSLAIEPNVLGIAPINTQGNTRIIADLQDPVLFGYMPPTVLKIQDVNVPLQLFTNGEFRNKLGKDNNRTTIVRLDVLNNTDDYNKIKSHKLPLVVKVSKKIIVSGLPDPDGTDLKVDLKGSYEKEIDIKDQGVFNNLSVLRGENNNSLEVRFDQTKDTFNRKFSIVIVGKNAEDHFEILGPIILNSDDFITKPKFNPLNQKYSYSVTLDDLSINSVISVSVMRLLSDNVHGPVNNPKLYNTSAITLISELPIIKSFSLLPNVIDNKMNDVIVKFEGTVTNGKYFFGYINEATNQSILLQPVDLPTPTVDQNTYILSITPPPESKPITEENFALGNIQIMIIAANTNGIVSKSYKTDTNVIKSIIG